MRQLVSGNMGVVPIIVLVGFVAIAALVTWYVITDRRRGHIRRMEHMPLDDGQPTHQDKP
jgi:Flp pilus assembly protein TadB